MKPAFWLLVLLGLATIATPSFANSWHAAPSDWMSMSQREYEYWKGQGYLDVYEPNTPTDVKAAQILLRLRGEHLKVDGVFGAQMTGAVCDFQRKNGLFIDGIIGGHTFAKLLPTLRRGSRGDGVRALQLLLHHENPRLAIDGVFGIQTENAVRSAQRNARDYYAPYDGIVRTDFWWSLFGNFYPGN